MSKKNLHIIAAGAVFCILYILLAVKPGSTELNLTPQWTAEIEKTQLPDETAELIPFRLGQNLGYFTDDGKVSLNVNFPYKAAISRNYYALFGGSNESASFFSAKGSSLGLIKIDGFPFFDDDRIYVTLPGGNAFCQCDVNGVKEWQYEYYSPVTCFASGRNGCVAGFADGRLTAFDAVGNVTLDFTVEGSDYSVILGAGISPDGKTVAALCGQNRQRFIVARCEGSHSKIIFHEYVDDATVLQVPVKFSIDGKTVYYGCSNALGIVDLENLKSAKIKVSGYISQIEESPTNGFVYILSRAEGRYKVTVLEPFCNKAAEFSFDADSSFIQSRGDSLYVGRDRKISKLTVSRK